MIVPVRLGEGVARNPRSRNNFGKRTSRTALRYCAPPIRLAYRLLEAVVMVCPSSTYPRRYPVCVLSLFTLFALFVRSVFHLSRTIFMGLTTTLVGVGDRFIPYHLSPILHTHPFLPWSLAPTALLFHLHLYTHVLLACCISCRAPLFILATDIPLIHTAYIARDSIADRRSSHPTLHHLSTYISRRWSTLHSKSSPTLTTPPCQQIS